MGILEQESVLACVRDTNDLDPGRSGPADSEVPTDWVLTRPQHVRETLVHDRHWARLFVVGTLKLRPRTIGMPIVWKYSELTMFFPADTRLSLSTGWPSASTAVLTRT